MNKEIDKCKYDKHGNAILEIDLSDNDLIMIFKSYMISNNYCSPSMFQFSDLINEGTPINKAIADTVINEFINTIVFEKIQEELEIQESKKEKVENEP